LNAGHRLRRGFSLIEALVATALFAAGIAGIVGALGAMAKTETMSRQKEMLHVLVMDKYNELLSTGDFRVSGDGNFSDKNLESVKWESTIEASGTENLWYLKVTATDDSGQTQMAWGLVFDPSSSSTTTTTTSTGAARRATRGGTR